MSRTSKALRRLSVPVLVGSVIMTGLSGLGFAGVANAVTPSPGSLTITPAAGYDHIGNPEKFTVTYAPSVPTAQPADQTIVVTVDGSGYFVPGTPGVGGPPPPPPTNPTPPYPTSGSQSTACTIVAAGGSCDVWVSDQKSEAVNVKAHDANSNPAIADATAVANFDAIHFSNCSQTGVNDPSTCASQVTQGSTVTRTVTYVQDGVGKGGVTLVLQTNSTSTFFTPVQPTGTGPNGEGGAHYLQYNTASCITDTNGQCKFSYQSDFHNTTDVVTATTSQGTTPYPTGATASEGVNSLSNATPARLDYTGSTVIRPGAGGGGGPAPQPGDAVQQTYTLYAASGGTTGGGAVACPLPANTTNAQCTGATLASTPVTLTVDHGFFTPNCTGAVYAGCTFTTTPAPNTPVGNLKSLGQTITVNTDANGMFTVTLGIAKDAGFDDDGLVSANVTAKSGSTTVNPQNPGAGTANQNCTTAPSGTAACPAPTTDWSTKNQPYNGGSVSWKSVDGSTISADPNHVPDQQARVLIVQATDQFGNLTNLGGSPDIAITKSGAGNLRECGSSGTNYTANNPCTPGNNAPFTVFPSYNNAFLANGTTPAQDRMQADSGYSPAFQRCGICPVTPATPAQDGVQTDTATWNPVPVTNFLTYNAGPPASATYDTTTTKTSTAVVKFDFYNQLAQPVVTFTTTPSNTVTTSTVVTVSATVKDQYGNPVPGQQVQFIRSGPNESSCNPTYPGGYTKNTDAAGNAGFSFTCSAAGTSSVNVIVNDASGNRLASGVQNVTFTNGTPTGTGTDPAFTINAGTILIGQCATLTNTSSAAEDILVKGAHAAGFTKINNLPAGGSMAICPSTNSLYQASNNNKLAPQKTVLVKPVLTLVVRRNGQSASFAGHIAPSLVGRSLQVFAYIDGGHVQKVSFGKTVAGGNYNTSGAVNHPGKVVHFFTQTYADDFNTSGRSRVISVQF